MKCFCAQTRRAARLLTRHYEQHLRPCGLTAAQFELLAYLHARPEVSQVHLAYALAADQTTLSRGLRLLIQRHWVERTDDPEDRRQVRYRLAEAGHQGLRQATVHWQTAQQTVESWLGEASGPAWNLLDRLGRSVESLPQPGSKRQSEAY